MIRLSLFGTLLVVLVSCNEYNSTEKISNNQTERIDSNKTIEAAPEGMVFIKGGVFIMGSTDSEAKRVEGPEIKVKVNSFNMDEHEVTNAQFAKFVEETGYKTIAERPINWEEIKAQLPPGTPKLHDSVL